MAFVAQREPHTKAPASIFWVLAGLSFSMLLSSLGTSIANVGLPTMAMVFGTSFGQVQWVVLAYLLVITSLIVGVGRLGDIFGRKRLLLVGIALFTLGSALAGIAPGLRLLVAARAVQGLGAAAMMALTMAFVGETMPKERTGSAMGLLGTTSAIGTAVGPALGGMLIAGFGWSAMFLINVPIGLLALGLAWRYLPTDREKPRPVRFDSWGTLLLAMALAAYALAMTTGNGSFGGLNLGLLVAGLIAGGLFVLVESRTASPLIRLATFRDPGLGSGLVMSFLVSTVMMATLVVGPFYLARGMGLEAAAVGLVVSVGPVVVALTGMPAGRLADRFGPRRMTVVGLVGIAAGTCALALVPAAYGVAGYIVPIIVLTLGYALFQTANNTAVMADVAQDRRGVIAGLLNLSRNLGLITGTTAMGAIFGLASGAAEITAAAPEAIGFGMRITFAVGSLLIVLAIAIQAIDRSSLKASLPEVPARSR